MESALDNILVVLHQPQDVVNIGGAVRAMLNMGLTQLRLVDPTPFTPDDVERIAHHSNDLLATSRMFATLEASLADTVYVIGTTARLRGTHAVHSDVRTLAAEVLAIAQQGPVALLFGPERTGLSNAALDRCHAVVRLPTSPQYPSLNLAQAVLLLGYELHMAQAGPPLPAADPVATTEGLERLVAASEQALAAIGFFRNNAVHTMRSLRQIAGRVRLSPREAALLTAVARQVVIALDRARDRRKP